MKSTGIVRRIDDLGRMVLPKELRRNLDMSEGDPIEIFTDDGGLIVLRKYSPACDYADQLKRIRANISGDGDLNRDLRAAVIAALDEALTELEGSE